MKRIIFCKIVLLSILLFLTQANTAQVTMGNNEVPAEGALLQLKDKMGVIGNGATAAKGLGMPRVELSKLKPTTPTELAQSIGRPSERWGLAEHIGLFVYNVKENICAIDPIFKGLYAWDGTQWEGVGPEGDGSLSSGVYEVVDPRDKEVYLARNYGTAGDWMLENMRYVPKTADGYSNYEHKATDAPDITTKYYAYANFKENPYDPAQHPSATWQAKKKNGLLYNWAAATNNENTSVSNQGQTSTGDDPTVRVQGICPVGWHVPSDKEWNDLEREIYNKAHLYSTYTEDEKNTWEAWDADWEFVMPLTTPPEGGWRPLSDPVAAHGSAMKSRCSTAGIPTYGESLGPTQGGFDLRLVGHVKGGIPLYYGDFTRLQSSSSYDNQNVWHRRFGNDGSDVLRGCGNERVALISVRCKKN